MGQNSEKAGEHGRSRWAWDRRMTIVGGLGLAVGAAAGVVGAQVRKNGLLAVGFLQRMGGGAETRSVWAVLPEHPAEPFEEKTGRIEASDDVTEIAIGVGTETTDEKNNVRVTFEPYDTSLITVDKLRQIEQDYPITPVYKSGPINGSAA